MYNDVYFRLSDRAGPSLETEPRNRTDCQSAVAAGSVSAMLNLHVTVAQRRSFFCELFNYFYLK